MLYPSFEKSLNLPILGPNPSLYSSIVGFDMCADFWSGRISICAMRKQICYGRIFTVRANKQNGSTVLFAKPIVNQVMTLKTLIFSRYYIILLSHAVKNKKGKKLLSQSNNRWRQKMYCKNFVIPGIQKIYTPKKSRQKFKCEYLVFIIKEKHKQSGILLLPVCTLPVSSSKICSTS